jgi:protein-disulfide isomerase
LYVKKSLSLTILASFSAMSVVCAVQAQAPAAAPSQTQKSVEAYLRNLYAFGPEVKVAVGPFTETSVEGLQATNVDVTIADSKQTVKFFVSKDGKYLVQGEISDLSKDPLAENRAKIDLKDAPAMGDANAPVTIVEYSDFECPVCRTLHDGLRDMLPTYKGQVKVVFKDFPIEQIHPWARTAALAGRCAYQGNPAAFWKLYDLIYDSQDLISASNAWDKMNEYAGRAGLNQEAFKGCLSSQEAGAAVDASRANGQSVDVGSTPTIFINGRKIVGADGRLIEQYIQYEIAKTKSAKAQPKK